MLTRGFVTMVSPDDADILAANPWIATQSGRSGSWTVYSRRGKLHRKILAEESAGKLVDHKDGNTFDNRRSNLRVCGYDGNARNKKRTDKKECVSQYKGVSRTTSKTSPWVAGITVDGKRVHLGCFTDEREAAIAYDGAAIFFHGEFAKTNADLGLL